MRISDYRAAARKDLDGLWGKMALFALPILVFNFLIEMAFPIEWDFIPLIVSVILSACYASVFCWHMQQFVETRTVDWSYYRVWIEPNTFVRLFVASLLQVIYVFLWSLLLIIPGLVKTFSY
ncbi:MAG: DUF975 family protein, partial [Bacilli bacterium]